MAPLERNPDSLPKSARAVLEDYSEAETNHTCTDRHLYGGYRQRERVAALADWTLSEFEGDLVEIGACQGLCSRMLAEVAARHGRKLIVIDPWVPGTQDCEGEEYEAFLRNTSEFKKHLEVIREPSSAPVVFEKMRDRPLAFVFVDGLHTFDACWSDFNLVRNVNGIVIADDARYNMEVLMAARIRARQYGWRVIQPPDMREALLIPEHP